MVGKNRLSLWFMMFMVFGLLIADLGLKTGFFWFMMFMVIHPTMGIQQECIYIYIYSTMKRDR